MMSKKVIDSIWSFMGFVLLCLAVYSILSWFNSPTTIGHDLEDIFRNKVVKDGT
jgi:hypothetical protein